MSAAMDMTVAGSAALAVLGLAVFAAIYARRHPSQLKGSHFQDKWRELQGLCKHKTTWPLAVINADKLLDDALKKRRYKGKTMGERMVTAQRDFSDNDGIWFAHKLRNRLVHEPDVKLKEADVKKALVGIRQALKDLGATLK